MSTTPEKTPAKRNSKIKIDPNNRIVIKGAREHNLKNVSLELPRDKLIVMTGLSGSGKSSLAFDTIFADGQRRYMESLSSYARQFLGQMEKPDVDEITGLSPAISIDQKTTSHNPRSTVGTVTEEYLGLGGGPPGFPQGFSCLVVLWILLGFNRVSSTGLSPSMMRLSKRFDYLQSVPRRSPQPQSTSTLVWPVSLSLAAT